MTFLQIRVIVPTRYLFPRAQRPSNSDRRWLFGLASLLVILAVSVLVLATVGSTVQSGVRAGDVIIELDGKPIEGVGDLQRVMVGEMVGRRVPVGLERDGAIVQLDVVPIELDR